MAELSSTNLCGDDSFCVDDLSRERSMNAETTRDEATESAPKPISAVTEILKDLHQRTLSFDANVVGDQDAPTADSSLWIPTRLREVAAQFPIRPGDPIFRKFESQSGFCHSLSHSVGIRQVPGILRGGRQSRNAFDQALTFVAQRSVDSGYDSIFGWAMAETLVRSLAITAYDDSLYFVPSAVRDPAIRNQFLQAPRIERRAMNRAVNDELRETYTDQSVIENATCKKPETTPEKAFESLAAQIKYSRDVRNCVARFLFETITVDPSKLNRESGAAFMSQHANLFARVDAIVAATVSEGGGTWSIRQGLTDYIDAVCSARAKLEIFERLAEKVERGEEIEPRRINFWQENVLFLLPECRSFAELLQTAKDNGVANADLDSVLRFSSVSLPDPTAIKQILCDVQDTLLQEDGILNGKVYGTIERFRSAGLNVFLVTDGNIPQLASELVSLGIDLKKFPLRAKSSLTQSTAENALLVDTDNLTSGIRLPRIDPRVL